MVAGNPSTKAGRASQAYCFGVWCGGVCVCVCVDNWRRGARYVQSTDRVTVLFTGMPNAFRCRASRWMPGTAKMAT